MISEGRAEPVTTRSPGAPRMFYECCKTMVAIYIPPACRLLELGSGPGFLASTLLDQLVGLRMTLLDFSEPMHVLARKRLGAMTNRAEFVTRSFKDADWPKGMGTFDAVVTNIVATRDLLFYGSYTQGLEDSAIAPVDAVNRGEPPAASRTWQVDGGLKYTPLKDLRLILGGFRIDKPYINLDTADVYRSLGRIQSSGIETSLSYENGGFTLLGGGVMLKPRIDSSVSQSQLPGTEPLGPVPLTLTINLDAAPPAWGPWAAGLAWNRLSSRPETLNDQTWLPAVMTLDGNIRNQWKWSEGSATLSLGVTNLFNAHALRLTDHYFIVWPEPDRAFSLTLTTDF